MQPVIEGDIDPAFLQPGQIIAHRYHILERPRKGGMGVVYRTHDLETGTDLMLKSCLPHLKQDKRLYRQYLNEIFTTERLNHKGIVKAYPSVEWDDSRYLVMEYIPQELIDYFLPALPDWDAFSKQLYRFMEELSDVVAYLASEQVVHRDLNRPNILSTSDGKLKLIDFGFAHDPKSPYNQQVKDGFALGRAAYLAPEEIYWMPYPPLNADVYRVGFNALFLAYNFKIHRDLLKTTKNKDARGDLLFDRTVFGNDRETIRGIADGTLVKRLLKEVKDSYPQDLTRIMEESTHQFYRYRMNAGELVHELETAMPKFM